MTKTIKKLEKERNIWKSKFDSVNRSLVQMVEEVMGSFCRKQIVLADLHSAQLLPSVGNLLQDSHNIAAANFSEAGNDSRDMKGFKSVFVILIVLNSSPA